MVMVLGRDSIFLVSVVGALFLVFLVDADGRTLLRLLVAALLGLAVVAFVVSDVISRIPTSGRDQRERSPHAAEIRQRHQEALNKRHENHLVKAASYKERILVPRQQDKLRRKEETLQRTLDPAWRKPGHKLGGKEPETDGQSTPGATGQDVVRLRQAFIDRVAPPGVGRAHDEADSETQRPTKPKRSQLPPEPDADLTDTVTVTLRTPQGRLHARRFLSHHTIQVILDFMTSVGYHEQFYTLCTTYPRQSIDDCRQTKLAELRLARKVTLHVERREEPD